MSPEEIIAASVQAASAAARPKPTAPSILMDCERYALAHVRAARKYEWNENDHPRAEDGKFGSGGGGGKSEGGSSEAKKPESADESKKRWRDEYDKAVADSEAKAKRMKEAKAKRKTEQSSIDSRPGRENQPSALERMSNKIAGKRASKHITPEKQEFAESYVGDLMEEYEAEDKETKFGVGGDDADWARGIVRSILTARGVPETAWLGVDVHPETGKVKIHSNDEEWPGIKGEYAGVNEAIEAIAKSPTLAKGVLQGTKPQGKKKHFSRSGRARRARRSEAAGGQSDDDDGPRGEVLNRPPIRYKGERWITLKAPKAGAGGKRAGTARVKIDGRGKIQGGPAGLEGRTLGQLTKKAPATKRNTAIAETAAKHGIRREHLSWAADELHKQRAGDHRERETAKRDARRSLGIDAATYRRLNNAGGDYSQIPGLDRVAREIAKEYPGLGLSSKFGEGVDESAAAEVWELIGEGARPAPSRHDPELLEDAAKMVKVGRGARKRTPKGDAFEGGKSRRTVKPDDDIPFAQRGEARRYAFGLWFRREWLSTPPQDLGIARAYWSRQYGRWVTMGAKDVVLGTQLGLEEGRKGGSKVFIDGDGTIEKGAKGLVGKKVGDLKKGGDKEPNKPPPPPPEPPKPQRIGTKKKPLPPPKEPKAAKEPQPPKEKKPKAPKDLSEAFQSVDEKLRAAGVPANEVFRHPFSEKMKHVDPEGHSITAVEKAVAKFRKSKFFQEVAEFESEWEAIQEVKRTKAPTGAEANLNSAWVEYRKHYNAAVDALEKKCKEVNKPSGLVLDRLGKLKDRQRQEIHKALAVKKPKPPTARPAQEMEFKINVGGQNVSERIKPLWHVAMKQQVGPAKDFMGSMTEREVLPIEVGERQTGTRAYYTEQKLLMAGAENSTSQTWVHELGHHYEYSMPGAAAACRAFVTHRCGKQDFKKLKDLFPGNGYGDDEKGRDDNFGKAFGPNRSWYVGKVYPDGSTEVLSMGIEKVYEDPAGFAKADPEYFRFVLGVMRGSFT